MSEENETDTGKTADVCSALSEEIPNETILFIRRYFLIDHDAPNPDDIYRAELLAKVVLKLMVQLFRLGMEGEYQPIFFAGNYAKPHTGGVTEFKRTYETIGEEPYVKFNLSGLSHEYEKAYMAWFKETFGVELNEDSARILQSWGDAV